MHRFEMKVPPPLITLAVALLMWVAAPLFSSLDVAFGFRLAAAVLFLLIGVMMGVAGIAVMSRAKTTIDPRRPEEASALVTSGIYRYTRNPMYLGLLFVLIAWGFYLGNLLSLLLAFALVFWLGRFQIQPEERALSARFGKQFDDYRATVRRWL